MQQSWMTCCGHVCYDMRENKNYRRQLEHSLVNYHSLEQINKKHQELVSAMLRADYELLEKTTGQLRTNQL